jgi:isopenicillin-N N-acyltransferase like protein
MADGFIHVHTGGSHREMGVDFGRAVKDVLRAFFQDSKAFYHSYSGRSIDFVRRYAMTHYYPQALRRYRGYMEEVRGIAEGAGMAFEDVFLLTADEEVTDLLEGPLKDKCTSALVDSKRGAFLLHNEDYPEHYHGRLVICHAAPADAPAFLALTYPYMLAGPACGLNAAGLGFTIDSMNFPPRRSGTLSNFVQRDYYASRASNDVRKKSALRDLTASTAVGVLHESGRGYMLELSTRGSDAYSIGRAKFLAHTNHAQSTRLPRASERPKLSSRARLAAAELGLDGKAAVVDRRALQKLLKSPYLMMSRRNVVNPYDSVTLASAVIDLGERAMWVAKRGPGAHDFRKYAL